MADPSLSTHQFRLASTISELLNRAVHEVRRSKLLHTEADPEVIENLALWLVAMADEVDPDGTPQSSIDVPDAIVERIRQSRSGDAHYLAEDLIIAAKTLSATTAVPDDVMATLDLVAGIVDAEASAVFRRMLRA